MARPRYALVTGLAGFTGRYVARELAAAGYEVIDMVSGVAGHRAPVDIRDRQAVLDFVVPLQLDAVVHLAAISFVAHGDAEAIYQTNIVGTRNLLEAVSCCAVKPRVVVLASSANVYGNAAVEPITEATEPQPANDYAVSKLAMEHMAKQWFDRLPIVITRPFNYVGRGQAPQFLVPKLVDHYRRREHRIELGNVDVWRDFLDVRVVAEAYRRLVELAPASETFNICSGTAHSVREILAMLADITGHHIKVATNPAFVRDNEIKRLVGSRRKLDGSIGALSDIPLDETLRWMVEATGDAA